MKFFLLFIALALFAKAESLSSQIEIPVEKYKLDNGLTVLLNSEKNFNTVSYKLGFRVASRHERPGITGISHMFEHLMSRGTKKYPHFDLTYLKNGVIRVNAFTSKDYTAYLGTFHQDQLELVLDVESDRMSNLILTQELLDTERGAVQEERKLRYDNSPRGILFENLIELSFAKHPYRLPIIGYEKDIANYTLKDLMSWYKTYYSPNNAVLVLSGNFSKSKAKKLIEKYFGNLARKEIPKEKEIVEPDQTAPRKRALTKDIQSAQVAFSYVGPPAGTKEYYALEFLSKILGSGESSVLYKKMVRETQLLPYVSTFIWDLSHYAIFFVGYPLLDTSKEKQIKETILAEIGDGLDKALTQKSLEKVKNQMTFNFLESMKKNHSRTYALLDFEMNFNDYRKIYEKFKYINEIELDFIKETAQKYLNPKRLNYVILKPKGK